MKFARIIAIILLVIALAIAVLWIWICFNPGVIYCYKGGLYMSMNASNASVLPSL